MGVLAIWRFPIKAMLGEALASVRIGRGGVVGDRRWVVVDRRTGEQIANKRGRTDARLRACRAELGGGDGLGSLRLTLPSGDRAAGHEVPEALSDLLKVDVALDDALRPGGAVGAPAGHHDFAPLHVLTTGTLRFLARREPASDWDARRFRANLLLDGGGDAGFAEDDLLGAELHGTSGLRISVEIPTPRCVVPTRAGEDLPADPHLLRTLARRHMLDLGPFGRGACLGAYAGVAAEGAVAVGDRLDVVGGGRPVAVAAAAVARRAGLG